MVCRPGPFGQNPLSRFAAPRTPGPLGCNDAADPGFLTLRGDTPGSLGVNDDAGLDVASMIDPMDFDYLLRHHELKSHLVESLRLSGLHMSHKLWKTTSIWKVAGAIVFRVTTLSEDVDGSKRAYHPPTETSWNGFGPGLGEDSMADAVGIPGVKPYAHSGPKDGQPHDEQLWALTAGCQLFRDLNTARGLEPKAAPPQPAPGQPAAGPPVPVKPAAPAPSQAALEARAKLDLIYKKHSVTKLSELETKSQSAVCVLYVEGRDKKDSQADWRHVQHWAGIQTDSSGKPIIRASGPNKGFYIPAITPSWVDPHKHPWVVLNSPEDQFGLKHTNNAVVIKNGESPTVFYGLVADTGPAGSLGEVSAKMMSDMGVTKSTPNADYIFVLFPENVSAADMEKEKDVPTIQSDAQAAFEAWTWEGRSGIDLIQELFPTADKYHQVQRDFADSKKYLSPYIDQLMLKLK